MTRRFGRHSNVGGTAGTPVGGGGGGPSGAPLLTSADFTYLGYYDVQVNGDFSNLEQGLTYRNVGGEIRFITTRHGGHWFDEFSIAGKSFGQMITAKTRSWPCDEFYDYRGIWWDEAGQRLWSNSAVSYTATNFPTQIFTRTLNNDLTVSNLKGPISLENVTAKRVFGGAAAIPSWFQAQFGVGPYLVGSGGGISLILQGGNASCGPAFYAMPDTAGYSNGATIPTGGLYKVLSDCATADLHRGVRVTLPTNYLDGGQNEANPATPPNYPPVAGAQWQSPRPDGKGWWTPCDAYWSTLNWIDTPTKQGIVTVLSAFGGKVYYMTSNVWCDYMQFELHIYNPQHLGQVVNGSRQPYNVEPTSIVQLTLPGFGAVSRGDMTPAMAMTGASFCAANNRLYIYGLGIDNYSLINRLFVYQVAI